MRSPTTSSNSEVAPVKGRIWAAAQKTFGIAVEHPQHQVGEAQIGEQLPLRDQQLQPVMVALREVGVLGDDLRHGRHVANLRPRANAFAGSVRDADSAPMWRRSRLRPHKWEAQMAKSARKRRARRKKSANHGKRPNA